MFLWVGLVSCTRRMGGAGRDSAHGCRSSPPKASWADLTVSGLGQQEVQGAVCCRPAGLLSGWADTGSSPPATHIALCGCAWQDYSVPCDAEQPPETRRAWLNRAQLHSAAQRSTQHLDLQLHPALTRPFFMSVRHTSQASTPLLLSITTAAEGEEKLRLLTAGKSL